MANVKISALPTASGIDGAADYLPIVQSSITNKINRNTLLGITGSPIGNTDSQTLSNKTLGNTNSFTIKDGSLTLQNTSSITKQAVFSLASITAGQTRTITVPDASLTLVGTATTQTLTNKTLTAPAISGGTIDNATVTVDSISGHSSATVVTVANLQISNGVLNSNNSVVTANIADSAVTPAKLQSGTGSGWSWSSYSPTWANLTLGNGTLIYRFIQMGKTVVAQGNLVFGSTTSVTGSATVTLPVTSVASYNAANQIGQASFFNTGTASYDGVMYWASTTTALFNVIGTGSTYATDTLISGSVPFSFTTGSKIAWNLIYEAA